MDVWVCTLTRDANAQLDALCCVGITYVVAFGTPEGCWHHDMGIYTTGMMLTQYLFTFCDRVRFYS